MRVVISVANLVDMMQKMISLIQYNVKTNRGFTLIEMVVAVGILALISSIVMVAVKPFEQFQKAQDARRKSDLSQIQKALEAYYQDNGSYPLSTNNGTEVYKIVTTEPSPQNVKDWGTTWTPYIQIIPKDTGERSYIYKTSTDGQSYRIYASLERGGKDPQACNAGAACSGVPSGIYCSTNTSNTSYVCNYGVSSPNVSP